MESFQIAELSATSESIDLRILLQSVCLNRYGAQLSIEIFVCFPQDHEGGRTLDLQFSTQAVKQEIELALRMHIDYASWLASRNLSLLSHQEGATQPPCRIQAMADRCPNGIRFWASKRGHQVETYQDRYIVVEGGILRYYSEMSDRPPYGGDLKG